ncbi:sigma-70 family RNA polymerase sigma factor [Paenibacillus sp. GD4]|uniref:sigma-70 family RNA polymerase sigma factor n=1 Tax=Paenibacillus sp. GD4 TaxID=3068890 RepID=UPI002796DE58|nr:sigma-70 family RNA polymerase sigma factor [Paenibacillus sp. GD4]MDQ1914561.1 sigma-70 family RNA polymerase sigma factor [Paenibacillus sp. GD4]
MRDKTDAELMALVLENHRPALEELYDRYVRLVYSFAMKSTSSEQASREIVQLVFTRLWTTKKGYDPAKGQFVNWLLTITRHAAIDYHRRERNQGVEISIPAEEWDLLPDRNESDPLSVISRKLLGQEIRKASRMLSESQARLIEHVYWKGYTLSEVARQMNEPLGTIKSRLHQTLKLLRKHLMEYKEG